MHLIFILKSCIVALVYFAFTLHATEISKTIVLYHCKCLVPQHFCTNIPCNSQYEQTIFTNEITYKSIVIWSVMAGMSLLILKTLTKDFPILGIFRHKVQHILGLHDLGKDEKYNACYMWNPPYFFDTMVDGLHNAKIQTHEALRECKNHWVIKWLLH